MNIFNKAPQPNNNEKGAERAEKIDELATELKIRWTRLYEEGLSANEQRRATIKEELKTLEQNLGTLKRAGKIPNMDIVRKELESAQASTNQEAANMEAFNGALRATGEYQEADKIAARRRSAEEALNRADISARDVWSQGRGFDSPDGKRGNA